jgi:hypothetical protein
LLPPQQLVAELSGSGRRLCAELRWLPPQVNAEAVGGYHVERTTWWPGVSAVTTRLTGEPVTDCGYRDETVVADRVNEYRVLAVSRHFPEVISPASFPTAVYGFAFMRYGEMVAELQALAAAHPAVCRLVDAGPAAGRGLRIWCMVLGEDTSPQPDRPGVLCAANAHGSEVEAGDVCLGMIREILRRYRAQDPEVLDMLRQVQVRIIPLYNPAGRLANERGFAGSVRKNHPGRPLPPPLDPLDITHCWHADLSAGTDLNRNFDAGWRYSGEPRDPASGTYPGARPSSAPETKAMMRMAHDLRPQISVHFHGPCGYPLVTEDWVDGSPPVDRQLHYEVARAFAELSAPVFTAEVPRLSPEPLGLAGEVAPTWFYQEFYGAHLLPEGFYEQVPYESRLLCVHGSAALEELIAGDTAALLWMARRVRGAGIVAHVRGRSHGPSERPLQATVEVVGHMDPHCSPQQTDRRHGAYRRMLSPGHYTLRFSAPGYLPHSLEVRTVADRVTEVAVCLEPAAEREDES